MSTCCHQSGSRATILLPAGVHLPLLFVGSSFHKWCLFWWFLLNRESVLVSLCRPKFGNVKWSENVNYIDLVRFVCLWPPVLVAGRKEEAHGSMREFFYGSPAFNRHVVDCILFILFSQVGASQVTAEEKKIRKKVISNRERSLEYTLRFLA